MPGGCFRPASVCLRRFGRAGGRALLSVPSGPPAEGRTPGRRIRSGGAPALSAARGTARAASTIGAPPVQKDSLFADTEAGALILPGRHRPRRSIPIFCITAFPPPEAQAAVSSKRNRCLPSSREGTDQCVPLGEERTPDAAVPAIRRARTGQAASSAARRPGTRNAANAGEACRYFRDFAATKAGGCGVLDMLTDARPPGAGRKKEECPDRPARTYKQGPPACRGKFHIFAGRFDLTKFDKSTKMIENTPKGTTR